MSGDDEFETVRAPMQQMEAVLLGLRQLRGYVGGGVGKEMVEVLIQETEVGLEQAKRNQIPTKSTRSPY